ncbi:MAG TPA: hypothetical protein VF476_02450 [Chitinophagaceae bacterium]
MKKLSVIIALLVMISCNNQTADKKTGFNDLSVENIKGEVSSIEDTPYKVDSAGKMGEMDSCCISVAEYNGDGNVIRNYEKDSKGTMKRESVFERHENGLWKSSKDTKDGKTFLSFDTQLDANGNYAGGQSFDSTGKMEFYYLGITQNEFGQVKAWKQYDKDSIFREEGEASFDKNLQTAFTVKDSVGKVKSSSTSKYNDKGEMTESSNTNVTKDSTTTKVTKYSYDTHDDQGNWTQRTEFDDKGKATRIVKRVYNYRKKEEKK